MKSEMEISMSSNNGGSKSPDISFFGVVSRYVSGLCPAMHRNFGVRQRAQKQVNRNICSVYKKKKTPNSWR